MSIVVTGATGHLGHLAVEALLERGVPAVEITATGRNIDALADLAARGVTLRHADYNDPASLKNAFADADKVLLVSSSEVGQRAPQHRNVLDVIRETGVSLLAYTSIPNAEHNQILLAAEHKVTEGYIRDSGLPYVFLRNCWYTENYTDQLPVVLQHGVVLGAAGEGRVSAVPRADYAAAAAVVLTEDGHAGRIYELGGDDAFTMTEYAAEVSRQVGKPITYHDLPAQEYADTLAKFGVAEPMAGVLADADAGVARGDLLVTTGDLSRLIGRPTTALSTAIAAALTL
jgi:NAD(P)H dehydrogenase (quinone)